jgi:DNA-binding FrmR family transcriptional regulator
MQMRLARHGDGRPGHLNGKGWCLCVFFCHLHRPAAPTSGLERYTVWGYMESMRKGIKNACARRLNRIAGQVRGIGHMIDEERYCIDIVTQISAVRAALRRLEEEILRDHVATAWSTRSLRETRLINAERSKS